MNRREFLFLKKSGPDTVVLSCEQLYMRYVDSTFDGTTVQLFDGIEHSLSGVQLLQLTDSEWLSCGELQPMEAILSRFRNRGGRVEYKLPPKSLS
jgi:hypothetical protein